MQNFFYRKWNDYTMNISLYLFHTFNFLKKKNFFLENKNKKNYQIFLIK